MAKRSKLHQLLVKTVQKSLSELRADYLLESQILVKNGKLNFHFQDLSLQKFANIYVIGAGKCAQPMACALETILKDKITNGAIITNHTYEDLKTTQITTLCGDHPIPKENTLSNSTKIIELVQNAKEDDLVIFLLSGGASSNFEIPKKGVTPEEIKKIYKSGISNSVSITELNEIRKKYSSVKGGGLYQKISPATCLTIALSDVPGDSPGTIGSGPTFAPDENPNKNLWWLIGNNATAVNVIRDIIPRKKFPVLVNDRPSNDTVESVATNIFLTIKECEKKACLVFGGETHLEVGTESKGGRNQHLALLLAKKLKSYQRNFSILCLATDGIDGNSNAAGAIVDSEFLSQQNEKFWENLETAIEEKTSNSFWTDSECIVETGPTKTNLMDIVICLLD